MKTLENVHFENFFNDKLESVYPEDHDKHYIDVHELLHVREDDDNCWNADIEFLVYANEDGIGFHHVIPAGYGEYTYDPIENKNFYYIKDFEAFLTFALTIDQREFLTEKKKKMIRARLEEIWTPEASNEKK